MKIADIRKLPRQRAVVTHGAGFLGSLLCSPLLHDGYSVVEIDDFDTGNLAPLRHNPHFRFVKHNITAPLDIDADWIFDFACCASPQHCQHVPEQTMRMCIQGAMHVLHHARRYGARTFPASTSEIYGKPEMHSQPESYRRAVRPTGPRISARRARCAGFKTKAVSL